MKNLKHCIKKFSKNEEGATMVEYAIMVALIAIISIAVITGLGQEVNQTFSVVNSALGSANG
ncbi:MAG: Flp family type IVb pilin [Methylococcaceae bacterium]